MEPAPTESVDSPLPAPRRKRDCEPKYRVSPDETWMKARLMKALFPVVYRTTTVEIGRILGDAPGSAGQTRADCAAIKNDRVDDIELRRLLWFCHCLKVSVERALAAPVLQ